MRPAPVLAALLLAGCVSTPAAPLGDVSDYAAIEASLGAPIDGEHDHTDPALHQGIFNLERLATTPGRAPPPGEFYGETAVKDGYAYLSKYGPDSGMAIFDVADLADPQLVGSIRLDQGFEPDVEVSDDGAWAFWSTQRVPFSPTLPALEPQANLPRGVHIIDIRDKASPRWAGFSPTDPDGPHSITYHNLSGRHLLLQSVYALAYAFAGVEVPGAQRLVITELDTSLPVATLRVLSEYREEEGAGGPGKFPHDVSVQVHPRTNQTLAYLSYWNQGLVILDIGDPAHPVKVGKFQDFGPAPYGNVHMARAFPHLVAGRHITVVEPEVGGQPDTGYMTFIDTTDPADPRYISSWLLPGNLTSQGLRFSPHYFDVADGRVALASYHAGLWVIDVHDAANLAHPRSVAFAEMPSARSVLGPASAFFEMGAFDAWWYEDHIVVGDILEGLGVYRYTGPAPGPEV